MNNNTPKMTSRIDAPNLQPGLYHPVNQLDPRNPQIYRPISPISQQTIQFPQNFGSIPSNSTPSNANRPKKKIFELVDPSAQNMSINKSPMRTHSPMNSGQMSNPPFINQREFHPEPQQNIHNLHTQYANQPNFNNPQQVPYNRNIQNEQMQMFSNPQEYTFSNQQIHHYPSQSHQYYKPPVNEVLTQKPKWQSSHPSMSGDPYAHNNSSIVHLNNSSISSDKHYPYPHVNNNFPSTNTGSTIENEPLVVDFDATSVYSTTSTSRRTKPIVIMNINIGNGASEEIKVFEGDDPNEVARNFCIKYNLPPALHSVLVKNLGVQMDKYYALKAEKMQQKLNNLSMLSHSHYPSEPVPQNTQNIVSQSHQHIRSEPNHQNNKNPPAVSPKAQSVKNVDPKNFTKPNQQSHSMNSIHSEGIDDGRSDTKSETKSSKQGTFDRLYQQGMKNIQQKEAVRKELKQRELDQELKNSTFRPTINKHSKEAAARRQAKVEEELAKDGERQTERKEKAKLLKEKLELEGCVFDHEVNGKNLHSGSKTTRSKSPVHNKLYEEGVSKKKEKQKSIDDKKETYSFKPFINPESLAIVEKNRAMTIKEDPVQRLYQGSIAPKKSVHKPLEDLVNTDPKTGQKFFQPQINKDNEYYQKASTRQDSYFVEERIEVDEDLFKEVKNSRSSRSLKSIDAAASKAAEERSRSKSSKSIREQDQPVRETFRGVSFGQKNDNISDNNENPLLFSELDTNKKKHVTGDFGSSAAHTSNKGRTGNDVTIADREMLMKIFQTLDSNRDGQITEQDVDVSGLDAEVLEVISDVIFSLEDGVIMALDDFTKAIVANNMLNKLRDIHGLPTYEVAPNFITFQSQEVDIKSVQGHNAQQQDDLDNILFGGRDTNTSKSSAFSMNDNTPTSTKGLTKRYQELTEKNFSGKK